MADPRVFSPVNLVSELVIDTEGDNKHWIQLTDDVRQRPLMFDCTNGAWANLLSIRPGGRLECHYHTGPVHAFVLKGSWRYLEHDWVAGEGTFVYEPPGEIHTLEADPKTGMTTFFVTRGALIYTDNRGQQIGFEDVFTRLARFRRHVAENGLDPAFIERMIR
ncbi:MAG TPA: 2,4'-dihydroxyacetophenone dioxygenase family protein [Dongiaceae bacterium]|nr:2,4'-dihydroxyacetophenone dioxygenase family protein [Dongiaceae bacterium]